MANGEKLGTCGHPRHQFGLHPYDPLRCYDWREQPQEPSLVCGCTGKCIGHSVSDPWAGASSEGGEKTVVRCGKCGTEFPNGIDSGHKCEGGEKPPELCSDCGKPREDIAHHSERWTNYHIFEPPTPAPGATALDCRYEAKPWISDGVSGTSYRIIINGRQLTWVQNEEAAKEICRLLTCQPAASPRSGMGAREFWSKWSETRVEARATHETYMEFADDHAADQMRPLVAQIAEYSEQQTTDHKKVVDMLAEVEKLRQELAKETVRADQNCEWVLEQREACARAERALLHLRNEVSGLLGSCKVGLREAIGNTNLAVLREKCDEATKALALVKSSESTKGDGNGTTI